MKIRTLIVDDEANARQVLRNILEMYVSNVEIIGEAENVKIAKEKIDTLKPQLVFLDVQMPDGTAFDLLKSLKTIDFGFIIVTAFENYAIKAIKFSAIDYILKPVNTNEVINAVEKVLLANPNEQQNKMMLDNFLNRENRRKRVILKTQNNIYSVVVEDIIRCEADKNYTTVFIEGKREILLSRTLKEIENLLSEEGFFRVHQSHLINIRKVEHYEKGGKGFVHLTDKTKVPVSSRRREHFVRLMERL